MHRRASQRLLISAASLAVAAGALIAAITTAPAADAKADANPGPRDVIVHLF